jgi:hypothetical protein
VEKGQGKSHLGYEHALQASLIDEKTPFLDSNPLYEAYRAASFLKHVARDFATICCKFQDSSRENLTLTEAVCRSPRKAEVYVSENGPAC